MKRWSFKKQILAGLVLLFCCCILSSITKQGIFTNIAWVVYGASFVLHPVCPESQKWRWEGREQKAKRSVRLAGAIIILLGVLTRFGY